MAQAMEQEDDVGRLGDLPLGDSAEAPAKAPVPFEAAGLRRKRLLVGASVAAAIGSSLCCIIPIAAAVTGIGTIAAGAVFETWRPYLLCITGLLLGAGFLLAYRDYQTACIPGSLCATKPMTRWSFSALGVVGAAVVALAAFPYYSGSVAQVILGEPSPSYSASSAALSTVTFQIPDMDCPCN
jgi:mercuric ion transport protein